MSYPTSNDDERLIVAPIYGGMLRKPKVWGIPSDVWILLMVFSIISFIDVGMLAGVFAFVFGYATLFLICLWDEDFFKVITVNLRLLKTESKKYTGYDSYAPY